MADAALDRARAGDRTRLDEAVHDFLEAGRDLGLSDDSLLKVLAARVADDSDNDGGK